MTRRPHQRYRTDACGDQRKKRLQFLAYHDSFPWSKDINDAKHQHGGPLQTKKANPEWRHHSDQRHQITDKCRNTINRLANLPQEKPNEKIWTSKQLDSEIEELLDLHDLEKEYEAAYDKTVITNAPSQNHNLGSLYSRVELVCGLAFIVCTWTSLPGI